MLQLVSLGSRWQESTAPTVAVVAAKGTTAIVASAAKRSEAVAALGAIAISMLEFAVL
jgi:hypothetical protein